jgi:hypothetical protein
MAPCSLVVSLVLEELFVFNVTVVSTCMYCGRQLGVMSRSTVILVLIRWYTVNVTF